LAEKRNVGLQQGLVVIGREAIVVFVGGGRCGRMGVAVKMGRGGGVELASF
jgi:hypothetical protein